MKEKNTKENPVEVIENEEVEALKETINQLQQSLQIERENNRLLENTIVRLSAKLTGVIQ